jgi:hypothetical protein
VNKTRLLDTVCNSLARSDKQMSTFNMDSKSVHPIYLFLLIAIKSLEGLITTLYARVSGSFTDDQLNAGGEDRKWRVEANPPSSLFP